MTRHLLRDDDLSPAEQAEILDLVTRGHSSKEIARLLGISPKTVEFHRSNLLRKHDAKSAVDLVRKAAPQAQKP